MCPPPESLHELFERLECEQLFLKMPDVIVLLDDPVGVERVNQDVVRESMQHLIPGREDARSKDPCALRLSDEPELDREPVESLEPRSIGTPATERCLAEELIEIGKVGFGQHRHVTEDIVEEVGRRRIVKLFPPADVVSRREDPAR